MSENSVKNFAYCCRDTLSEGEAPGEIVEVSCPEISELTNLPAGLPEGTSAITFFKFDTNNDNQPTIDNLDGATDWSEPVFVGEVLSAQQMSELRQQFSQNGGSCCGGGDCCDGNDNKVVVKTQRGGYISIASQSKVLNPALFGNTAPKTTQTPKP